MNKIIFKLGWPGALIILIVSLSLGIYAIVNQSFVEKETQKTTVVAEEEISIVAKVLCWQIGVINHDAAKIYEDACLKVVMNRFPKI